MLIHLYIITAFAVQEHLDRDHIAHIAYIFIIWPLEKMFADLWLILHIIPISPVPNREITYNTHAFFPLKFQHSLRIIIGDNLLRKYL